MSIKIKKENKVETICLNDLCYGRFFEYNECLWLKVCQTDNGIMCHNFTKNVTKYLFSNDTVIVCQNVNITYSMI